MKTRCGRLLVPLMMLHRHADAGTLLISMGRVANCPLQNGGYLDELGGSRRITMGVYLPVSIFVYMYLHIHH